MSASLKDIASALNLSKTTVSWVLSGRAEEKGISPATRQRVLRYATDLDYQPNLLARSLNTGTTGTIVRRRFRLVLFCYKWEMERTVC
ncbi:MAG: LacI family DNA-binding transcriptional regulator [Alistipes onderdonkii]